MAEEDNKCFLSFTTIIPHSPQNAQNLWTKAQMREINSGEAFFK